MGYTRVLSEEPTIQALIEWARLVRLDRRANPSIRGDGTGLELLLSPRYHALIETVLAQRFGLPPRVLAGVPPSGHWSLGFGFCARGTTCACFHRAEAAGHNSLAPNRLRGHDANQFRRFIELPLWGFCNFHTIHLYARDDLKERAVILPAVALDPTTSDAQAERLIRRHDATAFLAILEAQALAGPIAPRNAREFAEALAHAARLTRQIGRDQCSAGAPPMLADVRAEFRETLFAYAAAGGYDTSDEDALFANAFAQTLTFGLLLAREASGQDVDRDAYHTLPGGTYPLLRALTQDEILELLGVGFDVMRDTVNVVNAALLAPRGGADPILYFYEDFLGVFDPEAKKRDGVFFTPVPVARYMVAAVDRALRNGLATQGLLDPSVLLLDPACGTGTSLIAAANLVAEAAREAMGEDAVAGEIAALATRLHGFEILVGPYTVPHYRLLREVAAHHVVPTSRLPIYLADTLTPAAGAMRVRPHLGFLAAPIVAERQAADALKRETPIIAIVGNPPYRRLSEGEEAAITAGWHNGFREDIKGPVRNAGWGIELSTFPDLYIAFWRWSLWKLFESEGALRRGVLCLITNHTFLAGHPCAGLRQMLRRRFDAIEIIDLRGDSRGARPAGIKADENVFAIQAGVCILMAVATGEPRAGGLEAGVRYADVWRHGAFTARDKLALLGAAQDSHDTLSFVEIGRRNLDDFVPKPFDGLDWPSLSDCFAYKGYGVKTQHDDIAYGLSRTSLVTKLEIFRTEKSAEIAQAAFKDSRKNSAGAAQAEAIGHQYLREISFRPLDRRWLYHHPKFVDEMANRPNSVWGGTNRALYALPSGTGAGPGVWQHGLLPDYHAFRGSYGGYALPLWDRRHGGDAHNFNSGLLEGLVKAYGRPVTAEDTFDAITALLSATSYTRRFAWDLEETFAHVSFPADMNIFFDTVHIGAEIRALETFAREPVAEFRSARLAGSATGVTLAVPPIGRAFQADGRGSGTVALQQDDRSLRLINLPERVPGCVRERHA